MPPSLPDGGAVAGDTAAPAAALLRLSVPNELAAIESTRLQVLAFIGAGDWPLEALHRLELVLEEVLMNRVMHAFPEGGRHHTDLSVELAPDALVLCFEDDGVAFNPLQTATSPVPADTAAPGGFGLLLVRRSVRAWDYRRIAGRNRFTVHLARG